MMCVVTLIPNNIRIKKFSDLRIIFGFGFVPQKDLLIYWQRSWWHSDRSTQWQCWHDEGSFADCWLYGILSNSMSLPLRIASVWGDLQRTVREHNAWWRQLGRTSLVSLLGWRCDGVRGAGVGTLEMWRGPVSEHDCGEKPPYRRTTARPSTRHCGDLTNNNTADTAEISSTFLKPGNLEYWWLHHKIITLRKKR